MEKVEERKHLQEKVRAFLQEVHENEFDDDEYDEDCQYSEDGFTTKTCSLRMFDDGRSESIWDEENDDSWYSDDATSEMSEQVCEEEHGEWTNEDELSYLNQRKRGHDERSSERFATMFIQHRFSSGQSQTKISNNLEKSLISFLATQFSVFCCLTNNSAVALEQKKLASVSLPSTSSKTYDQHLRESFSSSSSSSNSSTTSHSLPSRGECSAFKAWLAARSLLQYADSLERVGVKRVADLIYLSDEDLDALAIDYDDRIHFYIHVVG